MKNNDLQKRKNALVEKLETFKKEQIAENEFEFLGVCGKLHTIKTNLSKEIHGVLSGQFIFLNNSNELLLCVGTGKGCTNKKRGSFYNLTRQSAFYNLWFLRENENRGLCYLEYNSFKELETRKKATLVM